MARVTTRTLKATAALAGYTWGDEEITRIAATVEKALALVEKLDTLPLSEVEPVIQFRMFTEGA